ARPHLRGGSRHQLVATVGRASSVLKLLVPLHLDGLEDPLVGALRVVVEIVQPDHPLVHVGKSHRERVRIRVRLQQRDGNVFRVAPFHFGISTTTLPFTIAWQPRRECSVSPSAVSRRSSSSGSMGERLASPSRTMTWQVVQAQDPPQLCSRWMSFASAMSSSEPGRPWSASGYFSSSTSTVTSWGRKVTLCFAIRGTPGYGPPAWR